MNKIKWLRLSIGILAMQTVTTLLLSTLMLTTLVLSPTAKAISLTNNNLIQKLLVDEANKQGLDPTLALAIAEVESNFDPRALSKAGAMGVMPIMPAPAAPVFGVPSDALYDASINIYLGITFIKQLLTRYNQRLDIALSHYNGGSAVQDKFGQLTVIPATKKYVNKVMAAQDKFKYKAYQLSTMSSKQTMENEKFFPDKSLATNKLTHQNSALYQTSLPLTKEVIQPEKLYSATTFDQSLYKKVETLRTLRLHNIMRNTQNKSVDKTPLNKINYRHSGVATGDRKQWLKKSVRPLSDKRKKVLRWERMFN